MTTPEKRVQATAEARRRLPRVTLLGLLAVFLILAVALASGVLISTLREDGVNDRRRELDNLAITLAEQTARAFQSLQIIQKDIIDHIEDTKISDREGLSAGLGTQAVYQQLREKISGLPYLDAITIIDDTGRLINFSRYWPIPSVNVADRDYFLSLKSMQGPPLFISEPVPNRGTGTVTIYLAHRFTTPDGRFLGLVLGAMEQAYFERFYGSIRLGDEGLIALVRSDGAVLARYPGSAGAAANETTDRANVARRIFGPDFNGDLPAGTLDGKSRIAVRQQIGDLPLAIVVTDSTASIARVLWGRLAPIAVAAAFMCVTIALLTYGLIRHVNDERAFADTQRATARLDPLTGLSNRLGFAEQMEDLLRTSPPQSSALLFIDLDYFKAVNDTLGHDIGDVMLARVAQRILRRLPPGDTVARLGGDEFAILHRDVADDADALDFAQSIIEVLREPFLIDSHQVLGGCSIGIALHPRDGRNVASLQKNADLALYRSKSDGRGVARVFQEEMEQHARERRVLELDLQAGWKERQFHLDYQPIFHAATGALAGFEALARWHHPTRGNVPPDLFIPLAEETGLILPLGAWVLMEACRAAAKWPPHLFVAVNLSPIQFRGAQAFHQVRAALEASGLDPRRLEIEITESTLLLAGPMVRATLDQFAEEGITITLDDFGTGYSSLRYLKVLRIGRIKVDRSFVEEVETQAESRAIVEAITNLAAALSLRCTAEGIETEEQKAIMIAHGCSHLQGYLLGGPGSAEDALRLACATTA